MGDSCRLSEPIGVIGVHQVAEECRAIHRGSSATARHCGGVHPAGGGLDDRNSFLCTLLVFIEVFVFVFPCLKTMMYVTVLANVEINKD